MTATCTEDPCDRPVKGRGLCNMHYQKARNHGTLPPVGDRSCRQCGTPIPAIAPAKTRFCSRQCLYDWHNGQRAEAYRAARQDRPPCAECGAEIPPERKAGSLYCSAACKKKAADARWRERSPHYNRQYLYGITPEQWTTMLAAQGGRCAICGTGEWPGKDHVPRADHDHETGRFRGILCDSCNAGLGRFGEDPARLRAAAAYLEGAPVPA